MQPSGRRIGPEPAGETPDGYLRCITYEGTGRRWPEGMPAKVQQKIEYEMDLISELRYEHYFLTVADIVRFAHSQHISARTAAAQDTASVCGINARN